MRVGAEDRKKLIAAVVLALLAAYGLYSLVARPRTPASAPSATPQARRQPARRAAAQPVKPPDESLDPTLRLSLLHSSEDVKYEGTGRNIFRAQADEPPPVVKSPMTDKGKGSQPVPAPAYTPPPPPPIPLRFYGFASSPNDPEKKIFLTKGDTIFIAKQGDVVDRQYRIVKIGKSSVDIEDMLNNNTQSIPLIQS